MCIELILPLTHRFTVCSIDWSKAKYTFSKYPMYHFARRPLDLFAFEIIAIADGSLHFAEWGLRDINVWTISVKHWFWKGTPGYFFDPPKQSLHFAEWGLRDINVWTISVKHWFWKGTPGYFFDPPATVFWIGWQFGNGNKISIKQTVWGFYGAS